MTIAIEAQRIFRPNKHGMDFVALETIRELRLFTSPSGNAIKNVITITAKRVYHLKLSVQSRKMPLNYSNG